MSITLSILETNVLTVLRSFLLSILPTGTAVIKGQTNRVPEPAGTDFVVMTPVLQNRLSTNVDDYQDAVFTGSIAATTMTITDAAADTLVIGSVIFGVGLADGTTIMALGTGTGGVGTYTVAPSQTVLSQELAAGTQSKMQETKWTIQLDVHGPSSTDNAQIITTMFRDDYGVEFFAASDFDMAPLYTSDPRQMPFINGENQYEDRWVIDAVLQVNPVAAVPQQFADTLDVTLINVDATYPPT